MTEAQRPALGNKAELEPKQKPLFAVYDIDQTFLSRANHLAMFVHSEVEVHNQIMAHVVENTKTSYCPILLTTRPSSFFLDRAENASKPEENKISPLRFLRNLLGYSYWGGKLFSDQIRLIGCENGVVWLVRKGKETDEREKGDFAWRVEVSPEFKKYREVTRETLRQILQSNFVDTGEYKFEPDTMILLNLQKIDESEMSPEEKTALAEKIKQAVKKEGHEEILDKLVIDTSQHDLDIYPKELFWERKWHGVKRLLSLLNDLGYPNASYSQMILAEDSLGPVKKAGQLIAKSGGKLIAPANAQGAFKSLVSLTKGVVSQYETFWGTMAGVYEVFTGVRPTVKNLEGRKLFNHDRTKHLVVALGRKASLLCGEIITTSGYSEKSVETTKFTDLNFGVLQILKSLNNAPDKYVGTQFFYRFR